MSKYLILITQILLIINYSFCQIDNSDSLNDVMGDFDYAKFEKEFGKDNEDPFSKMNLTNIITLNDKNYTQYINENENLLILIYSVLSEESLAFLKTFIAAAEIAKNKQYNVSFIKIEGTSNANFVNEYNIVSYPFIIFIKNKTAQDFKGTGTEKGLVNFIDKKLFGDIKKIETIDQLNNYKGEPLLINTIINVEDTLIEESFNKFAEEFDKVVFIKCITDFCLKEYGKNEIILIKSYDEKINLFSEYQKFPNFKKNINMISDFVGIFFYETGSLLTEESLEKSFYFNKSTLFYFRDSNNTNQTKYDIIMKELGKELRKNNTYVLTSDIKGNVIFEETGLYFCIDEVELPCLFYLYENENTEKMVKRYKINNIKPEQLNKKYLIDYLNDIHKGKIKRELKTTPLPKKESIEAIGARIVVGKTFDKLVMEETNNVCLLLLNAVYPDLLTEEYFNIFKNLGHKYNNQTNTNIIYALMDGEGNEARTISFTEKDLPSIYLFTNAKKKKQIIKFNPKNMTDVSQEEIEFWVNKNLKENEATESDL